MNSPVTLGDLVRNDKLLWVFCCDHERDVNPSTVRLPAESRARSGQAHEVLTVRFAEDQHQAELYPGGVEAMRGGR